MWMWIALLVLPVVMLGVHAAILYRLVLALWQRSLLLGVLTMIWLSIFLASISLDRDFLLCMGPVVLPLSLLSAASSWWSEWITVRKIKKDKELLRQAKGCRLFYYRPSRWGWNYSYIGRIKEIEDA